MQLQPVSNIKPIYVSGVMMGLVHVVWLWSTLLQQMHFLIRWIDSYSDRLRRVGDLLGR